MDEAAEIIEDVPAEESERGVAPRVARSSGTAARSYVPDQSETDE